MSSRRGSAVSKVEPPTGYPPEEGRYIRGDDYSPVAVLAILDTANDRIPVELNEILQAAIDSGAALAGSVQTENIGIEKIVVNIVANPNIRYLILCWRESRGHLPTDAIMKLHKNGVDEKHRIIGAEAPTPFLYNLSLEVIERFREQVEPINLISDEDVLLGTDPKNIRAAVLACRSKEPVRFMDHILYDKGAYDKPAICSKITLRIKEPWKYQTTSEEADIIERIKKAAQARSTGKQ